MRGKKQKKRSEEKGGSVERVRLEHGFPLKISFNLCKDSIACFVGQKKNNKKKGVRATCVPQKPKRSLPKTHPVGGSPANKIELPQRRLQNDPEDIVQGSLNSILTEIEEKGIACPWAQPEDPQQPPSDDFDSDSQQLWNAFSLNSSFCKSHASTVDVHPSNVHTLASHGSHGGHAHSLPGHGEAGLQAQSMAYFGRGYSQGYYLDYSYKAYEQGAMLYQVFPEYIHNDARTTVMIRNIPNKYTIRELSEEIDQQFSSSYDFLYLPCDIKNQCNVGYGFINFLSTDCLKAFYERFQGKKWARFRSEKICNLTYARLQGLHNLIEHFENSKVQKDKKYRPIIRQFAQISHLIKSQQLL